MSVLTLAQAKEWLGISHSAQDNVIQILIDSAEAYLARFLNVSFSSGAATERLDGGGPFLYPTRLPITAITSVTDLVTEAVLDAVIVNSGLIARADSAGNPLLKPEDYGPPYDDSPLYAKWYPGLRRFEVVYTGGHAAMPAPVKQAVLMLVHRAWTARGGEAGASAAGIGMNFGEFMRSDIMEMVKEYSRRRVARI